MVHKVFVSYHHASDQNRACHLKEKYGDHNTFIDRSLQDAYENETDDEILQLIRKNHLKNSTVTIVLVGDDTKNRKWVDWEIYSSLRSYGDIAKSGLLAIYLPNKTQEDAPARLVDNIQSGYAVEMKWSEISTKLEAKINEAYANREKSKPDNTRPRRKNNS